MAERSRGIRAATGHFKAHGRMSVDVPEWLGEDGKPLRVWWKRITYHERNDLMAEGVNDADILIAKAQDESGASLFEKADKPELMGFTDYTVITRVASLMTGVLKSEDVEKNSGPIPS